MALKHALLLLAAILAVGRLGVHAQSSNGSNATNLFWLTVNVSSVFLNPDDLTTYPWTNNTCIPHGEDAADAVEVIQMLPGPAVVWIAAGADPISQDYWITLPTDLPGYPKWRKNGDGRNTTFVESCMFSSPDVSPDCDPYTDCFGYMSTPPLQGYLNYTWLHLNTVSCNGGNQIYPSLSSWNGMNTTTPPPGYMAYSVSKQCKQNVFPNTIYRMQDPWGGWYAMHAHEGDTVNATNSILPPGFTVAPYTFPDDEYLLVNPVGEECYLVILRDANNNGFYQVVYGNQTMWSVTNNTNCSNPQAAAVGSSLPPYELLDASLVDD